MRQSLLICALGLIIFGCKQKSAPLQVSLTEATQTKSSQKNESDYKVKLTLQRLIEASKQENHEQFFTLSTDTIEACSRSLPLQQFINSCSSELFSELMFNSIKDSSKVEVQDMEVISQDYPDSFLRRLKSHDSTFVIKRVQVYLKDTEPYVVALDFIETKEGYKFFSCDVYGGPQCCY